MILPFLSFSQINERRNFSVDLTAGAYSNFRKWKENGVTAGSEFSLKKGYFVYSVNFLLGVGISKNRINNDGYIQGFLESDVLIGKEFTVSNTISVQPQMGVGYLHLTNHFQEDKRNLIGLPIQIKILFFNDNRVSVGLIPRAIFNKVQNNYSLLFTIHFK